MGRYRKKPVVVEAIQWNDNTKEIEEFCGENCSYLVSDTAWEVKKGTPIEKLVIHTLEGDMVASRGDYIIKGVNGEFYPCKPDIFEKTYEIEVKVYKTGRLIDADAMANRLRDSLKQHPEWHHMTMGLIDGFIKEIEAQPTAYDVEKVVAELEKSNKTAFDKCKIQIFMLVTESDVKELVNMCFEEAINIVKAGGGVE